MKPAAAQSFTREVKKLLTKYSIIPAVTAIVVTLAAMALMFNFSIRYSAVRQCEEAVQRLDDGVSKYLNAAVSLSKDMRLAGVLSGELPAKQLAEELYGFVNGQQLRADFFLIDLDSRCVLGSSKILSSYLLPEAPYYSGFLYRLSNSPNETVLMLNDAGFGRQQAMVLSIGRAVVEDGATVGYFVFELSPSETLEYISGAEMGEIVVTNRFHTALLTSKNSYLDSLAKLAGDFRNQNGLVESEGANYYVANSQQSDFGLEVYVIVELGIFGRAMIITCLVTLALLLASIIANNYIANRLMKLETGSVDRLLTDLARMQREGIYIPIEPAGGEFSSLEETYSQLIADIQRLVEANKQEVLMRTTAEIKQLESQFNPHFIFNTLEVIRCYIKLDPAGAERMILNFSQLLRYSIDSTRKEVPLKDDLKYVDCYLSMIQMRESAQIEYQIDIGERTEGLLVPKLIIQPVVENAVKYAGKGKRKTVIGISASLEQNGLLIIVKDDGRGIPGELLSDIRAALESEETPAKFFGLYNVHRRIRLMYGEKYGITIQSEAGRGTTVSMLIPQRKQNDD